jgi:hypothetical protein
MLQREHLRTSGEISENKTDMISINLAPDRAKTLAARREVEFPPRGSARSKALNPRRHSMALGVVSLAAIASLRLWVPMAFSAEESCAACGQQVGVSGEFAHRKDDPTVVIQGAVSNAGAFREEINGRNFTVNYNYERGAWAAIPFAWDEAKQTLTIGRRSGEFPGMLKERALNIVWVSEGRGAGVSFAEKPDAVVHYNGDAVTVSAP